MKLLFILLALTCIASVNCGMKSGTGIVFKSPTPSSDKEMKMTDCATKNKMDEQMLSNYLNKGIFSATEETKAFPTCVAKNFGIMNEDGSLTKEFMDDPQNEKCKNIRGKDLDETAAKVIECIFKEGKHPMTN